MTENRKNSQMAPWRLLDIYKCGSLRSPQSSNRHGVFIDSFSKIINKKQTNIKRAPRTVTFALTRLRIVTAFRRRDSRR